MMKLDNLQLLASEGDTGEVIRGLDIIVSVGGKAIGGQKNCKLSIKADSIDTSTKTSGDWKRKISGAKEWSATCDGFYYTGDEGYDAAVDAVLNSTAVDVIIANKGNTVGFKGKAYMSGLDLEADYEDATTYDLTFEGNGKLEKASAV
jgi:TP901-1 family phage major tail protein|nr:MAG TPA: major tail protein [Caudoviricetes sp.]